MAKPEEKRVRDWYEVVELALKAAAGIGVPAAIFLAGNVIAGQQRAAADQQRSADRVSTYIHLLASENPAEARMAAHTLDYLAKTNQFPEELAPVLLGASIESARLGSPDVSKAIIGATESAAERDEVLAAQFPARIYIHIRNEEQRSGATRLRKALEDQGDLVPGIERLDSGPRVSELRYFREKEEPEAQRIAETLRQAGGTCEIKYVPGHEDSKQIRPEHFELWLSPAP